MPDQANHHILLYLWKKRTLYMGELPHVADLTPAASNLLIGLEKPFTIRDYATGEEAVTRSALIPAGIRFGAKPDDQIMVNCYLDPFGRDLKSLEPEMTGNLGKVLINHRSESNLLAVFRRIFADATPAAEAYPLLMTTLFREGHDSHTQNQIEESISKVIELIQSNPLSNEPTEWLAEQAGLTPSQLNRWFKRITGVPVRRYRLWHRLFVTATMMAFGKTLTEAAHEAGFSDSSHLNHTFRSILGMTPSFVFLRSERLKIFTSQED